MGDMAGIFGVRVEEDLLDAVTEVAMLRFGGNVSALIRAALREALASWGAQPALFQEPPSTCASLALEAETLELQVEGSSR